MKNNSIAQQELWLNIKKQNIQVKEFTQVGYEFDENTAVFVLILPFPIKSIFNKLK